MPPSKVTRPLRYEPSIDEADFTPKHRPSGVVTKKVKGKPNHAAKGKRSTEDMLASMSTDVERAKYILERVAGFEDQIAKLLTQCSPETLALVLKARKSLVHYAPEKD